MPSIVKDIYQFGDFRLNVQFRVLSREGTPVALTPKAFDVLLVLVQSGGRVIEKHELMNAVWPDSFVEESNLTQTVFMLRKILQESTEHRYILTVPGKGYRFVSPVTVPEWREPDVGQISTPRFPLNPSKRPRSSMPRLLAAGSTLLLLALAGVLTIAKTRQGHLAPFEAIKTTRLTSAGQTVKAAISPDGRYIAHTQLVSGQESLRVRRANLLDDVELIPAQAVRYLGVGFSPDSETVYPVIRGAADASGILYRVPVIGGPPQKVRENIASPIAVSPDGKRYAFVRESAEESMLMLAEFGADREQKLILRRLPTVLDYPTWSPDGQRIAYTSIDSAIASPTGSDAKIMEVRIADGVERVLSSLWGFAKQPVWLGDGSGLVVSARGQDESGLFHLWYVSYPAGVVRKISEGLHNHVGASVTNDSRSLVTVEENTFFSIWRTHSARPEEPSQVVSVCGWSAPRWTPGQRIVFEEELDGRRSLWMVDADGKNRRELTSSGNSFDHSISRNGQKLVWLSDRSGSPVIWTMDMENGNPIMVAPATGEPVPDLSPDGQWVAFTAVGTEHWATLWRVASSGGTSRQLNDKLWMRPVVSPDGKWIAGYYSDHQLGTQKLPESIGIISADGGQVRKVITLPPSVSLTAGPRWSPDGMELSYIIRGKDGDNIWSQPVTGEAAHQVTQFIGLTLFTFDWSADGKELAFSRGIEARDVVLVQSTNR